MDCKREGLGDKAAPKAYGSYCKRHAYARQTASRAVTSVQNAFVMGFWTECATSTTETLITRIDNTIHAEAGLVPATDYKTGLRVAWGFELACVRRALELGRRMTTTEEDEIIAAWGGDRSGQELKFGDWLGATVRGEDQQYGVIRLPDQMTRIKFRALKNGGPTCVAEPEFADYYRMHFNADPEAEFLPAPVEEDEFVEYDGMTVLKTLIPQIEAAKRSGTWQAPVESPHYIPEDPEAIMSVTQLMAEYEDN